MITFECIKDDCLNKNVKFDFMGNEEFAECGQCKTILEAKDFREDPVYPVIPMGSI
jgi:hypothetical protein